MLGSLVSFGVNVVTASFPEDVSRKFSSSNGATFKWFVRTRNSANSMQLLEWASGRVSYRQIQQFRSRWRIEIREFAESFQFANPCFLATAQNMLLIQYNAAFREIRFVCHWKLGQPSTSAKGPLEGSLFKLIEGTNGSFEWLR